MNSVDDRNLRQENFRTFVAEACTMSSNVQHHHCTTVYTPQKHVTFSDPSIPVDNFYGNARGGQRNIDANFDFDNGYANVRKVVALLPEFNPSSTLSLNARQFLNRVDILRNAYRWNDGILIFAI